jgi:Kef-type K+ transport system membrane component KefB
MGRLEEHKEVARASVKNAPSDVFQRYAHRYGVAMNRYEKRAQQERKTAMQASLLAGTIAVALIALALVMLGMNSAAPVSFYKKAAIAVVILLLLLRYVARKLKSKDGAAKPDPESQLKLR